ncbi:MAG TPA: tetratricopeptide repeat protein [Thermoanaerobaculia bacterium]|nr:tetratricopeptide repeat protein [Thermoanaerobaculia bacterium]
MSSNPPTSAKIEDLRARVRLDPKSRMFYPLAEELRKLRRLDDAEKVLRDGLEHHGTYLSAWIGLGRVLIEKGAHREATEVLMTALALDPGNVVCARLLANSYLVLGEKVEAIKKFKLVRALHPADDEVDEQIERLDREIEAERAGRSGTPPPSPPAPARAAPDVAPPVTAESADAKAARPSRRVEDVGFRPLEGSSLAETAPQPTAPAGWDHPFASTEEKGEERPRSEDAAAPETVEEPFALDDEPAPEAPSAFEEPKEEQASPASAAAEGAATMTMAELYARQGHVDAAREIYERLLEREPSNQDVRRRLESLDEPAGDDSAARRRAAVDKLERWLQRMGRRDL